MNADYYTSQLSWLKAVRVLKGVLLLKAVLIPFFNSKGISLSEALYLQTIFSLALVVFELPTGDLADRKGAVKSLRAGAALSVVGFTLYFIGINFWYFAVAEVLIALGLAFQSGADEAYAKGLHERSNHKLQDFTDYELIIQRDLFWLQVVGSIVGGLVAMGFGPLFVNAGDIGLGILAVVCAFKLDMAGITTEAPPRLTQTLRAAWQSPKIRAVLALSITHNNSTYTGFWLSQSVFALSGIPLGLYGFISALFDAVAGFVSSRGSLTRKHLGERKVLAIMTVSGSVPLAVMSTFSLIGALSLLGQTVTRGLTRPLISGLLMNEVEPNVRSTLGSVRSLVNRLASASITLLVGLMINQLGLRVSLLALCGLYTLAGLLSLKYAIRMGIVRR